MIRIISKKEFTANKYVTLFAFLLMLSFVIFSVRQRLFFIEQARADHWLNSQYAYRRLVTLNGSLIAGAGNLTNFPVLVSFTNSDLNPANGFVTNSNGYDIIFGSGGHTPILLPHERTFYDAATGKITAWVLIPSLTPGTNTDIYIYYGNTSITTSQSNPTAVWGPAGANYKGVWHLDETAPCSTTFADATGNGLIGSCVNSPTSATGQIDGARNFIGTAPPSATSDGINIPSLTLDGTFTFEAWVRPTSVSSYRDILVNTAYTRWLGMNNTDLRFYETGVGGVDWTNVMGLNSFQHIAFIADGTNIRFYRNGSASSPTARTFSQITDTFGIGYARQYPNSAEYFAGQIDEVRISNGVRSVGWIQTSYNNQSNQDVGAGKFILVLGARQLFSMAGTGIVRSSEIDFDWVPGQSSWGQVIWSTNEPEGDVRLRIYYTVSTPCDTVVPNSVLPGNASPDPGFDISASPLTISALNPTIYNRICLEATLTASASVSPTLNDWRVTWLAPGVFNGDRVQSGYRWYNNANGLTAGTPLALQDTPATSLMNDQTFRLRLTMHVNNVNLPASSENYRLQFAPKLGPTCGLNMAMTDEVYSNVTDTTAIAFADNSDSAAINGASMVAMSSDPQHDPDGAGPLPPHVRRYQSYQELGTLTFTNAQGAIAPGEDGLWDFTLRDLSAPSHARYCFRIARISGGVPVPLDGYAIVPEVMAGASYVTNGVYISNAFAMVARAWNALEWRQTDVSASCPSCRIRLQIQTSTDGISWQSGWCGPSGSCDGSDYYTIPSGTLIPTMHNTHRWIRYRATFEGNGNATPILEEVRINYQQ